MKTSKILGVALGLVMLAGLGGASVASARDTRPRDLTGVWRLDERHGDGAGRMGWGGISSVWNTYHQDGDGWDRDGDRDGDRPSDRRRYRGGRSMDVVMLPDLIQIERSRRQLRVEDRSGRLVRRIGTRTRSGMTSEQVVGNTTIIERYSLDPRGRSLVVHTTVHGLRGTRSFTSVYQRA